jgi:hypothetical protein
MGITHAKVSAKSDGGDSSLVRPSDWNAPHVVDLNLAVDLIKLYTQDAQNTASWSKSITALSTGERIIVCITSWGRDVNTPTLTNVTFTEVLAVNFSTTIYTSAYVGVASGTSGTTLGITATGSNWIIGDVYVVADTLTPTAGTSSTLSNTDVTSISGTPMRVIGSVGSFFIMAISQDNGTTSLGAPTGNGFITHATQLANSTLSSGIGRTLAPSFSGSFSGGTGGADGSAGVVLVT